MYCYDWWSRAQLSIYWSEVSFKEAKALMENIKLKSKHVERLPRDCKFGLVAKRIRSKQELREEGYLAYDLDDF
jgi:hypothetical protein